MSNWRGKVWFGEDIKEHVIWKVNNVFGGIIGLLFGEMTTKFLRVDFRIEAELIKLLESWGNPPILDDSGSAVTGQDRIATLIKEQRRLKICIERLLAVKPPMGKEVRGYYKLKPTERIFVWQPGVGERRYGSRLERVSLEPGTLSWQNNKVAQEDLENLQLLKEAKRIRIRERLTLLKSEEKFSKEDKILVSLVREYRAIIDQIKLIEASEWKVGFRYVSVDVLALLWLEVFHAASKDLFAVECSVCRSYFFYGNKKTREICRNCTPPSRRPIGEKPVEEQEKIRARDRIRKLYERGTISLLEANRRLRELGLSPLRG